MIGFTSLIYLYHTFDFATLPCMCLVWVAISSFKGLLGTYKGCQSMNGENQLLHYLNLVRGAYHLELRIATTIY